MCHIYDCLRQSEKPCDIGKKWKMLYTSILNYDR